MLGWPGMKARNRTPRWAPAINPNTSFMSAGWPGLLPGFVRCVVFGENHTVAIPVFSRTLGFPARLDVRSPGSWAPTPSSPQSAFSACQYARYWRASASDSMMTALFDCEHSPVGVQLVLPLRTALGVPCGSTYTTNLLWPMYVLPGMNRSVT